MLLGKVVMPGLVNCHTHAGMSLFRGCADDIERDDWKNKFIKPAELKMTKEDMYTASMLSFIEMIKSGTTTLNDMYFDEEETAKAAEAIGIRAVVSRQISDFGDGADSKIKEAGELYNNWNDKANGRIKVFVGLDSPDECSQDTIKKTVELAKQLNCPIHMQYLETKDEIRKIKEKYNMSVIDYVKQTGLFDVKTILAQGVWADEYDIMELQFHDTSVVNTPISNCKLGSGIGDMKFLLEGGVNIALGTDDIACSNTLDMFESMKSCAYSQKVLYKQATAISARKVLELATIKGAKALGLQKDVGTIEIGKKADLIIIDLNKPHLAPLHNVYSALVYSANGSDVDTVIIDGNVVMENRKILTVDEGEIVEKARLSARRIFAES